jgi:hypothetical protein
MKNCNRYLIASPNERGVFRQNNASLGVAPDCSSPTRVVRANYRPAERWCGRLIQRVTTQLEDTCQVAEPEQRSRDARSVGRRMKNEKP